eukprot:10712224-Lingulodinium_polyedra.AAC.1
MPLYTRLQKASKVAMTEAKRVADDLVRARAKRLAADIAGPKGDVAAHRALRKPAPGPASVVWVD